MTKQTNVDELLIDEIRGYLGTLPETYIRHILTLARQHDKSQRNDVIAECVKAVATAYLVQAQDVKFLANTTLDQYAVTSAIEALKNKD